MTHALRVLLLALLLVFVGGLVQPAAGEDEPPEGRPGVPGPELQKAIDEAIDRGAEWLKTKQHPNGSFGGLKAGGTHDARYEPGATALAGLALLAAGDERVAPNGPQEEKTAVDKVYGYLRAKAAKHGGAGSSATYDASVMLMFVTAYWRGKKVAEEPKGRTRPGRRGGDNPCNLPPDVMEWVQTVTNWLISVSKKPTFTWGYPTHRDDHSNTQYAFLGLRAARDCGAKIPPQVFMSSAKTLIERQEQEGPKVLRILPNPDPNSSPYAMDAGDRARGWSYLQEPFLPTGSMTTAGIAILAICHDALTRPKRLGTYTSRFENKLTRSVQDGFSWLDKNWAVDKNPGRNGPQWHYYYLYGLERAGMFGGRDLVGQHDWYIEGATYLIGKQREDGRWSTGVLGEDTYEASDVLDTVWAILFLAKATRPMPPIEAPVVTPGD